VVSGLAAEVDMPHVRTRGDSQADKRDTERNDRIIAVEQDAHSWADIKTIDDLGKEFCRELEEFFVNYRKLTGKEYRVLGLKSPAQAGKLVKGGRC
jgi:inorganic pyrophosphatase